MWRLAIQVADAEPRGQGPVGHVLVRHLGEGSQGAVPSVQHGDELVVVVFSLVKHLPIAKRDAVCDLESNLGKAVAVKVVDRGAVPLADIERR